MVDTFRHMHGSARSFTYLANHQGQAVGSRLDRVYITRPHLQYITGSTVVSGSSSDHRLAVLELLPRRPPAAGRGLRRVRLHFAKHRNLRESMQASVERLMAEAPANPHALLAWWPAAKEQLRRLAAHYNREAWLQRVGASQEVADATRAQDAALARVAAGERGALAAAVAAAAAAQTAARRSAVGLSRASRIRWLHHRERPYPHITQMVRPPQARTLVPALRAASGRITRNPRRMAQLVADYWQRISSAPAAAAGAASQQQQQQQQQAAHTAVLAAVQQHGGSIPAADAAAAGAARISEDEVRKALRRMQPGKSPGKDGIPADLYRICAQAVAPVMAAVFTAIGEHGVLPHGFLDGVITVLFKKDDALDPANYRPITLLGADYRVLARVLAQRLGPVLDRFLGPEQSAFLPGRHIGDDILLLQLLPDYLRRTGGRTALVAFLDFYKAYDTVDRAFLLDVMDTVGAGAGLHRWVATLLNGTRAAAVVNGHMSHPVLMTAGVRQGCPVAPLLYLFIAHAQLCWLRHNAVGIDVEGRLLSASQYADDCKAFLRSDSEVAPFLLLMDTFALASGQRLNLDKVELLRIGALPPEPDAAASQAAAAAAAAAATAAAEGAAAAAAQQQQQQQAAVPNAPAAGQGLHSNSSSSTQQLDRNALPVSRWLRWPKPLAFPLPM